MKFVLCYSDNGWPQTNLAYPTLAHLREFAEKGIWPLRHGLIVTHCDHYILCRRSHEVLVANQRHYQDSRLKMCLPDLTFQSDSCVIVIKV